MTPTSCIWARVDVPALKMPQTAKELEESIQLLDAWLANFPQDFSFKAVHKGSENEKREPCERALSC